MEIENNEMDSADQAEGTGAAVTRWPFLTADLPGIGGQIKVRNEDFVVDEAPLYPMAGEGTHVFFRVEKNGLATCDAAARIADVLRVRRIDVGYAGRKDTRALTRQWMSVEHVDPERIASLDIEGIKILETVRHTNKIKTGHLRANRFIIKVRGLELPLKEAEAVARRGMEVLVRRGVPNYFGPQRFGSRNDSQELGLLLIKNRLAEFTDLLLGHPDAQEPRDFARARRFYEQGDYERAMRNWPPRFRDHRRMLKALMANGGDKARAAKVVDKSLAILLVSAWQSDLFNRVLAARMPHIDRVLEGDMAWKHANGACFIVTDAAAEQPRCERFEISPTGPLYGLHCTRIEGGAGEIENPLIEASGLTDPDFRRLKQSGSRGGRRPLRFGPRDVEIGSGRDDLGDYLELRFELDSGCYATTLLRELMKKDVS